MTEQSEFATSNIKRKRLEAIIDNAWMYMNMTKDIVARTKYAGIINKTQHEYYEAYQCYYFQDSKESSAIPPVNPAYPLQSVNSVGEVNKYKGAE